MVLNHESIEALSGNIRELGDGIHESRLICALHPLQMRSEQEKKYIHTGTKVTNGVNSGEGGGQVSIQFLDRTITNICKLRTRTQRRLHT